MLPKRIYFQSRWKFRASFEIFHLSCLFIVIANFETSIQSALTISQRVERFACDVERCEGGAFPLRRPPSGQRSLQGWGPITDHPQGFTLHRDDLTAFRLGCVRIRPGHWEQQKGNTTALSALMCGSGKWMWKYNNNSKWTSTCAETWLSTSPVSYAWKSTRND